MATREIIIADAHSTKNPAQTIKLEMSGGSPWFAYVWIGDKLFTIYDDNGKISVKRT